MQLEIDKYLIETLISSYRDFDKICCAIDRYLLNVGSYPSCCNDSIMILYDNLIQQMIRKSKLMKVKDALLRNVKGLSFDDRQIFEALVTLKQLKKEDICFLLNIKERTLYRRIESLYKNLAELLIKSKDNQLILEVCRNEYFISAKYLLLKERRQSYTRDKAKSNIEEVAHG